MSNENANKLFALGEEIYFGIGGGLSETERCLKAIEYYVQAGEAGHGKACVKLVNIYAVSGPDELFDLDKAIFWAEKAGELGETDGYYCLLEIFQAAGPNHDIEKAVYYLEKCIGKGVEISPKYLTAAKWFFYGENTQVDYKRAVSFLLKCGTETPEADYMLGLCYENGWGLERDYDEAMYHYMLAFQPDYTVPYKTDAYLRFAILEYTHKKDYEGAIIKLEHAWYKDNPDALYHLGTCYILEGKNKKKGYEYLKSSARLKHVEASIKVAEILLEGVITTKSVIKSADWYAYAYRIGGKSCAIKAAQTYELESGDFAALENAKKWYDVAANDGDEQAKKKVIEFENNKCPNCGAFFSKTTKKVLWMEQAVCAKCGKKI